MRKISLFTLILLAITMTSCGGGDKATTKLLKELNSSYNYDGKEATLTGYLTYNSGAMIVHGKTTPALRHSNWQKEGFARPEINFGKEPNCVWIPDKFRLEDIEIYDSNGEKHGVNTKVTLKGTVRYTNKEWEKATVAEEEKSGGMKIFGAKSAAEKAEEAKKAAEERRKKTGDPNDYSFTFQATAISVAK